MGSQIIVHIDPVTGEEVEEFYDPELAAKQKEELKKLAAESSEESGEPRKRRREIEVARQVVKALGRPIASLTSSSHQSLKFWTYTPTYGWTEDTTIRWLADEIHGSSGDRILGIIGRKFAIPTHTLTESCFVEWVPGDHPDPDESYYSGYWRTIQPKSNHVYFADGVYDLDTNVFTPFVTPVFGPLISVPYDPDATNPEFLQAVERHFIGRPSELRRFKQECGRILQPHVPVKYEVYVISRTRDSGKSTLMNAIAAAPGGKKGMSTLSQRDMAEDMFALSGLMNKFCNVSSDSGSSKRWGETLLKLTSGPVALRFMHKEPFSCMLTAKLWNTCNTMQELDDTLGNMSNRVKVFEFRGEPYAREGKHGTDAALNIGTWTTPEMRQAIVAWMFDGLFDLRNEGPVEESRDEMERRMNEADPERARFIEKVQVTGSSDDFVPSTDLIAAIWPGEDGRNNLKASIRLSTRMKTLFNLEPTQKRVDGKVIRGYSGVTMC